MALEWHPQHLVAVLKGQRAPDIGEPVSRSDDEVPGRLAAIEYRHARIMTKLGAIDELSDRLEEINANVESVIRFVDSSRKESGVEGFWWLLSMPTSQWRIRHTNHAPTMHC